MFLYNYIWYKLNRHNSAHRYFNDESSNSSWTIAQNTYFELETSWRVCFMLVVKINQPDPLEIKVDDCLWMDCKWQSNVIELINKIFQMHYSSPATDRCEHRLLGKIEDALYSTTGSGNALIGQSLQNKI